jgi:hypothetical protein
MKAAVTIVSGLCVGLLLAFNGLTPLIEAKTVWDHRGRVVFSALLGMASFTFVMAAVILGTIDLALQYEVQGFILWEMILTVASGFLAAGLICALSAKLVFPRPKPSALAFLGEQAGFGNVMEEIQKYIAQTMSGANAAAQSSAPPPAPTPEQRSQMEQTEERLHHPRGDMNIESQVGFVH